MKLVKSRDNFWKYIRNSQKFRYILLPFSYFYYLIIKLRQIAYSLNILTSSHTPIKTICVGNISAGGTGKTPVCAYIINSFRNTTNTALLTRGYRSKLSETPYLVKKEDSSSLIGDEAALYQILLDGEVPVIISPERIKAYPILQSLNTTLCIMDDGYQHFAVKADNYICLIDLDDFDEYLNKGISSLLPYGIFRELPESGISRADRVVFVMKRNQTEADDNKIRTICQNYDINSYSILKILPSLILDAYTKEIKNLKTESNISVLTAIAKPETFIKNLESAGYKIINKYIFSDHHEYSKEEWTNIISKEKEPIICTAKDWVKLRPFLKNNSELFVLTQKIEDISPEGENLLEWITSSLK